MTNIWGLSVGYNQVCFHRCFYLFYGHTFVSSCAAEEGLESGQDTKEARGGRMQHQGEGGGGGEEGGGG